MKIEDIQVFLKLSKTLSFFTTADEMFLSPSAVTYSIKSLEKQLNTKLFHRSSHGVSLTEKGEIFYQDMRNMMASWELALEHLQEEGVIQKKLHVGVISMTLQRDFSNIFSSFIEANPNVQPEFSVCPVDDPSEPLRRGKQDVAFVYQDALVKYPTLKHLHLVSAPMYCVMSREDSLAEKDAVTLEDLRGRTLFILPADVNHTVAGLRVLGDRIDSLGRAAVTSIIADDHNYCLSMVAERRGLTFAPGFPPTVRDTEKLAFRPFRDPEILLDFIADNLMPYLCENYNIDCGASTLLGHSMGGAFSHCALFESDKYENQPFGKYIIASPAFWNMYEDFPGLESENIDTDYGYFDRNESLDKSVFLCGGAFEDPDYEKNYNGHDSTLTGLEKLNDRLVSHGADVKYKLYDSHHYQYVTEMLVEYLTAVYPR